MMNTAEVLTNSNFAQHRVIARSVERNPATISKSAAPKISCGECRLQQHCLAKDLDSAARTQLGDVVKTHRKLKKREHLVRQEDQFESLYFIRSGCVKSYVTNPDGDELAVSFFMPGEMIGLDGLSSKHHTSSIVALEDTYICEIPYAALEDLCGEHPLLQKHFNELMSRQIVQEQEMTMLRGQKTAANQLMAFLINLSERFERRNLSPTTFRLPMTRKDIAGCLGLTIETVSRMFTTFQDQGLMEVNGRDITLTNIEGANAIRH